MSSNNKDATSTLQSVADSVSSTIQSGIAAVTGNPADQRLADKKQGEADAEHDLSHAAAKAGPFTVQPSGAIAKDDPDRTKGSWNQTVGAGKEFVGNLVGAEGLKQEGIQQNREGKGQEAEGQLKDLGQGVKDRVGGTLGGAAAAVLGTEEDRRRAEQKHDEGKARQRGVEVDLQKEAQHDPNTSV